LKDGGIVKKKWQKRFMEMAFLTSTWSKDSTQVGAVIAKGNQVISLGFNGLAKPFKDKKIHRDQSKTKIKREDKLNRTIHAEHNAVLFGKVDLTGFAIFTTHHPCVSCTAMLAQVGIKDIYVPKQNAYYLERWGEQVKTSKKMIKEAGIKLHFIKGFEDYKSKNVCKCVHK
jgi:dCMP deaminase